MYWQLSGCSLLKDFWLSGVLQSTNIAVNSKTVVASSRYAAAPSPHTTPPLYNSRLLWSKLVREKATPWVYFSSPRMCGAILVAS